MGCAAGTEEPFSFPYALQLGAGIAARGAGVKTMGRLYMLMWAG